MLLLAALAGCRFEAPVDGDGDAPEERGVSQQARSAASYLHDDPESNARADWMSALPDAHHLKNISIPGTHDTMALYGGDITQTQSATLSSQLGAGIRMLDIRCRASGKTFAIHHGPIYQNASFDDVLTTVAAFLQDHPRETILMRVKQEEDEPDEHSKRAFAEIFSSYADDPRYSAHFWRAPDEPDPELSAVRGKIVVVRDFDGGTFGLGYASFDKQDDFALRTNWDLHDKWIKAKAQMLKADQSLEADRSFFINYLSGSGGSLPYFVASGHSSPGTSAPRLATGLTTPIFNDSYPCFPRVACLLGTCTIAFEGTNILARDLMESAQLTYVGMIMADFPGPGLIDKIISLNTAVH